LDSHESWEIGRPWEGAENAGMESAGHENAEVHVTKIQGWKCENGKWRKRKRK